MISRNQFSQYFQDLDKSVADVHFHRSESEPGVDTVGIYDENHEGVNRKCFIWIRFDHWKRCEKGYLPHLRENASISETCALEDNALHNVDKIAADCSHLRSDSNPGVDAMGTCVENNVNRCRELWIEYKFDF